MSTPLWYIAAFNMIDLESCITYGEAAYPILVTSQNIHELMDAIRYSAVQIATERAFQNAITPRRMAITLAISRLYGNTEEVRTRNFTINLQNVNTFRATYIKARKVYIPTRRNAT